MPSTIEELGKEGMVFCPKCGYTSKAVQVGLKIIPTNKINPYDKHWDKKYLEENTVIWGEKGVNPFNKG